ncbi:uncharacterized protein LOC127941460 isoform X2 [Carassius gibelio]|uniref:uncharacterized protein LOC127941460 isoform X2 n=1 Tax=Carassius gibelio TaxID=101364 RepID=UPI002278644E|nr:uncharacterized protein LOC127941460 isoform X2 [Carassius gibelio]
MCLVWRYRLVVSIILLVVLCDVYASDSQPIGKVYPRGNHWAVDQDQQLERHNKHLLPPLLHTLMRGRTAPEIMLEGTEEIDAHKLLQRMLEERHHWEEVHERDRQVKRAEDVLLRALLILMQDDNES